MRLRLEDSRQRTVYNPKTGVIYFVNDCGLPLSGKAERRQRRANKQAAKTAKKAAKQERKVVKQQNKTARKSSRQVRRTDRVDQKGERKAVKRAVKVTKGENKLVRVQGRQKVIQARTQQRLHNVQARAAQQEMEPEYDPIEYQTDAYAATPSAIDYSDVEYDTPDYNDYEEDYEDIGYEEVYEDPELSAGLVGTALDFVKAGAKGVINSGKKAVKNLPAKVKAKVPNPELKRLQEREKELTDKLDKATRNSMIYGAAGVGAGILVGYFAGKK